VDTLVEPVEASPSATAPAGAPSRAGRIARGTLKAIWRILPPLLLIAALVAVWQIYCETQHVRPTVLPTPSRVVSQGWKFHDIIWDHTKATLKETIVGFTISVVIATAFAVAMDFSHTVRRSLYPLLVGSQTIPIIVLAPLMITWFGFGLKPKIILVVLITFFPVTVGWVDGFRSTEGDAMNLLGSMGAKRWKVFRYVRFPSALPSFFSGLRIAITYAVVGAIFAEYAGASKGLGIYMQLQHNAFRTDLVLAAVVVSSLISILLFTLVSGIQRLAIPWYAASRRTLVSADNARS
jgi:ABC-type nitrate/sulfonate/bicarbonate transport system permease component